MEQEIFKTPLAGDSNLLNYYRLEGNSNDYKGVNNGVDSNVSYNASYGKFGQGALFNGTSSKITISNATTFGVICVSGWFKLGSSADYQDIFRAQNAAGNLNFDVLMKPTGVMYVGVYNGTSYTTGDTASAYNNNAWHHFVAVKNGTALTLYIDGTSVATGTAGASFSVGGSVSLIGSAGTNWWCNGDIDDVAVFTRILTTTEITAIYTGAGFPATTNYLTNYRGRKRISGAVSV